MRIRTEAGMPNHRLLPTPGSAHLPSSELGLGVAKQGPSTKSPIKTMRLLNILLALAGFIQLRQAHSGGIEFLSQSVVFLVKDVPVTEVVGGIALEVFHKMPGTNVFIPKLSRTTGTGLITVNSNLSYLVTAKHVALALQDDWEMVMRGQSNAPLRVRTSIVTGQSGLRWFHHPVADVSVYPLPTITADGLHALHGRALPLELLVSDFSLPSRDDWVTAIGFPLGLGAEGDFVPLSRESKTASGFLADAGGKFFLLQDPAVSGYSGSPLIQTGDPRVVARDPTFAGLAVVSGGMRCWGFVSATYADATGGKMTRIVPAQYAVEMIALAEKELRIQRLP